MGNGTISREQALLLALLAFSAVVFAVNLLASATFIHDDTYIGFRYVRNLVETGDFSWNVGDRVEGYTNFLDLVLVAGLTSLGLDPLVAARLLHAAATAAMFAIVWVRVGALAPPDLRQRAQALGLSALLLAGAIPVWIWGGLETLLAAMIVTASFAVIAPVFLPANSTLTPTLRRDALLAGVLFALSVLTRPDMIVLLGATGLSILLFAPITLRRRIEILLALSVGPVLIVGGHEVFRILYYGDWLPNTFWAKSGSPLGLRIELSLPYIVKSFGFVAVIPLFLALAITSLASRRETHPQGRLILCLAIAIAVQLLYVVWAGGDHMPAARFLLPCVGVAAIGFALAASHARASLFPWILGVMVACGGFSLIQAARNWNAYDPAAETGRHAALWMNQHWTPNTVVALHTAGSTPWFAPGFTYIDMLGLNDRYIARRELSPAEVDQTVYRQPGHLKGDGAYVLKQQPDYIILGPAAGTLTTLPWFISDIELAASEEFRACYVRDWANLPPPALTKEDMPVIFVWYRRTCPKTAPAPDIRPPAPAARDELTRATSPNLSGQAG